MRRAAPVLGCRAFRRSTAPCAMHPETGVTFTRYGLVLRSARSGKSDQRIVPGRPTALTEVSSMKKFSVAVGICVLSMGLFVGTASAFSTAGIPPIRKIPVNGQNADTGQPGHLGHPRRVHEVRRDRCRRGLLQQLVESDDQHRPADVQHLHRDLHQGRLGAGEGLRDQELPAQPSASTLRVRPVHPCRLALQVSGARHEPHHARRCSGRCG